MRAPLSGVLVLGAILGGSPGNAADPGGVAVGMVRDAESGAPIPDAVVVARTGETAAWDPESGLATAATDAAGRFRLGDLRAGLQALWVTAPGYRRSEGVEVAPGQDLVVSLIPGGASVSGVVVGPADEPLDGVLVRAESEEGWSPPAARTDARGRFVLHSLEPGPQALVAWHPGFAPTLTAALRVEDGEDRIVNLRLWPGAELTGRLVGDEERPVAGEVRLEETEGRRVPSSVASLLSGEAAEDGRFRIASVPAGNHVLSLRGVGREPARHEIQVGGRERAVELGDIRLSTGLHIGGWVRAVDGAPLEGARVRVYAVRPMAGPVLAEAVSDADGRFAATGLEDGRYGLVYSAEGYARGAALTRGGAEDLVLELEREAAIAGRVVDERGSAVTRYDVIVRSGGARGGSRGVAVADEDGRFVVGDIAPEVYVVEVQAPGFAPQRVSDVRAAAGEVSDVGSVQLTSGGRVIGTVTDARGDPVAGATVEVTGPNGWAFGLGIAPAASTDEGGAFEVRGLPPGVHIATARHPRFAESVVPGVIVEPEEGPASVEFVLHEGGRIEGSALRRDGSALDGVTIAMEPEGGASGAVPPSDLAIAPDGSFVADHVSAGRYRLTLLLPVGRGFQSGQVRHVEVREGEVARADFVTRDILVSGRLTRRGTPLAGHAVTMHAAGRPVQMGMARHPPPRATGPERFQGETGADGSFELIVDEPGPFRVQASARGGAGFPQREVEIPDVERFFLELAFDGSRVSGSVVDEASGEPVERARIAAIGPTPQTEYVTTASDADGTFSLTLDDGDYELRVEAEGYAASARRLAVASADASLRFALLRGGDVSGRVVDAGGRGVGDVRVLALLASTEPGQEPFVAGMTSSLPDGSFRFERLSAVPHVLVAAAPPDRFAVFAPVVPETDQEGEAVTLALRPGGRLHLAARDADGRPVGGAVASVQRVDGFPAFHRADRATDVSGEATLALPEGEVELRVGTLDGRLETRASVSIPEGGEASLQVELAPIGQPRE